MLPAIAPPTTTPPAPATISRALAASMLGIDRPGLDKLMRAGLLDYSLTSEAVASLINPEGTGTLAGRPLLHLAGGEVTVLRTNSRAQSDPSRYGFVEPRTWIGFHVDHTDVELEDSSLRWWRCDPGRIVANQLYVVTVATYPVALYEITGHSKTVVLPGETSPRHGFSGRLLARIRPGLTLHVTAGLDANLHAAAHQIMTSRVIVQSGGPIGYLTAPQASATTI